MDKPDFILSGDEARLFPVLAETSREKRVASIFLAVLTQIPELAKEVLGSVNQKVGSRTKIRAFTEVVMKEKTSSDCRPDGLLIVENGRSSWSALIEAKVGKNNLDQGQVQRYVELAKANGIDAVITISNQFVGRADHSPVVVPKVMLRKVSLFHWSWTWLATMVEILGYQKKVEDSEQSYLLSQLNDFLAHPATGVERFTQMAPSWKQVVQAVANDERLKKNSEEVEEVVSSWLAEERDLCLHLSSHIGRTVQCVVERKLQDDPVGKLRKQVESLVQGNVLTSKIRVPDCASDIDVCIDLARKTLSASMLTKAPGDKKSTKARVNWLIRMLPEADEQILIRAHWPGRAQPTTKSLHELRNDPALIQTDNFDLTPHSFEILMVESPGQRFGGRRTFIEDLERLVPLFYDLVGANLKAWQASPPKPVRPRDAPAPGELEMDDLEEGGALPFNEV